MIYGYKPKGQVQLPQWANQLANYYWHIRVEGRDSAKRRRYYRLIYKEKLRLVEQLNIDQSLLKFVCRYLCGFRSHQEVQIRVLLETSASQMSFDFEGKNN